LKNNSNLFKIDGKLAPNTFLILTTFLQYGSIFCSDLKRSEQHTTEYAPIIFMMPSCRLLTKYFAVF